VPLDHLVEEGIQFAGQPTLGYVGRGVVHHVVPYPPEGGVPDDPQPLEAEAAVLVELDRELVPVVLDEADAPRHGRWGGELHRGQEVVVVAPGADEAVPEVRPGDLHLDAP